MITGWRDEALSVGNPPLAIIERAACRPLGITTEAVHLNAYVDTDTLLVARRAAHKQIDPGLWDNLVGGMVPAGESLQHALAREAWEEAGLQLDRLQVERGRLFHVRRPVTEGHAIRNHSHVRHIAAARPCIRRIAMVRSMQSSNERWKTSSAPSSATSSRSNPRWSRSKALRDAVTVETPGRTVPRQLRRFVDPRHLNRFQDFFS